MRNIARTLGDEINDEMPLLDARLPDGSRVAAAIPPCSRRGTTLTIRNFQAQRFTPEELVRIGTVPQHVMDHLKAVVERRQNILISGGTGSGKTTMLNALASFIDPKERVVLIEDTSEINISLENLVEFEAKEPADQRAVTIRDLLRATLRHRPDRIIFGRVPGRGSLPSPGAQHRAPRHALNHSCQLSGTGGNSLHQLHPRIRNRTLGTGQFAATSAMLSSSCFDIERRSGRRYVAQLLRLMRYNMGEDNYDFESVYDARNYDAGT